MQKVVRNESLTQGEFEKLNSSCIVTTGGQITNFKEFIVIGVTADEEHLNVICQGGINLILNSAKETAALAKQVIKDLPIDAQLVIALGMAKDDE